MMVNRKKATDEAIVRADEQKGAMAEVESTALLGALLYARCGR
jgi:hypothetical protein